MQAKATVSKIGLDRGQQLIGRGCATTAQCAAADFKEQLKQYIGSLAPSFTGTVHSFTCCQQNLCNNGGITSGGTTSSTTSSSSSTTSSSTTTSSTTSSTTKGGGNGCAGLRAAHFTSALLVAATVILSAF
ncbi:unnamed protein product [Lampetra planeri]